MCNTEDTSRTLVIVRHGKAEHPVHYVPDFERTLTPKGENDARIIGHKLKAMLRGSISIISSPAARAIQTANIFAKELSVPTERVIENSSLYSGLTVSNLIEMIRLTNPDMRNILVFGHNPYQAILASNFDNGFDGHMPTSCAVGIEFSIGRWEELDVGKGALKFHLYPKMFR